MSTPLLLRGSFSDCLELTVQGGELKCRIVDMTFESWVGDDGLEISGNGLKL